MIWLVDLSEIGEDDPDIAETLAVEIAIALELRLAGDGTPAEQLLAHLQQKQMLLILDQFDQLIAEGTEFVLELLERCSGLKLIMTAQAELDLAPEWLVHLGGLETIDDQQNPAVALFLARRAQKQHREIEPAELDGVLTICRLVQGNPLAIELAASWTRSIALEEIVRQIERSADFLGMGTQRTAQTRPAQRGQRGHLIGRL